MVGRSAGVGEQLVEVGWRVGDFQYQAVRLAAEFAESFEWVVDGYSSAGLWIADHLDIARRTANEWIRVGRCLAELPITAVAFETKEISFAKAKVLTRSATSDNEASLVAIAKTVAAAELPKEIARWLKGEEPDEVTDRRHHESRSLSWHTEADGMVVALLRMPPLAASTLMSAVDAQVMRQSQRPRIVEEPWPSLAQQRVDSLIHVLAEGSGGVQAEVVLHVRGDGATLDDGTPITHSSVAGIADEAFIRLLIHDAERRPINASSKQRHPTARQQRVVKERDRACVDCASTELLEFDHVPDYADSRRTVVDELELRCSGCHRFRHAQAG